MTDSDAKQHAPALDAKGEVARAMEMAADLCLIEDPPEEPFRSKYKARDLLIKAKQSHAREAKGGEVSELCSGRWGWCLEWPRACREEMGVRVGYPKCMPYLCIQVLE